MRAVKRSIELHMFPLHFITRTASVSPLFRFAFIIKEFVRGTQIQSLVSVRFHCDFIRYLTSVHLERLALISSLLYETHTTIAQLGVNM